jgi:mannose-1-phosphate guanylyltransferase
MDYAVIMAGGTGKRLWPLSRRCRPKQVLRLIDGETLLGQCYRRLTPIFPAERILVLTNAVFVDLVRAELPALPMENVIAEPLVRDTAGAIGLAATILMQRDPEAAMAVVTADQIIRPAEPLQQALRDALVFVAAEPQSLVTFGIQPSFGSTQYGYIKCLAAQTQPGCQSAIHPVEAFREKPDAPTAQAYFESGDYAWNAGLFVWKARTILHHFATYLPRARAPLDAIGAAWNGPERERVLAECFAQLPKISIDFAIMEKAPHVYAIRLNCEWLDMGSFGSLRDVVRADGLGNVTAGGLHRLLGSERNIVVTEADDHLIALIGVQDLIVAHSADVTLVCAANQTERLKELLAQLETEKREMYL